MIALRQYTCMLRIFYMSQTLIQHTAHSTHILTCKRAAIREFYVRNCQMKRIFSEWEVKGGDGGSSISGPLHVDACITENWERKKRTDREQWMADLGEKNPNANSEQRTYKFHSRSNLF